MLSEFNMKKISIILSVLIAGLAATSCFDMEEHPFTLLDAGNYFSDEAAVKQVIANILAMLKIECPERM